MIISSSSQLADCIAGCAWLRRLYQRDFCSLDAARDGGKEETRPMENAGAEAKHLLITTDQRHDDTESGRTTREGIEEGTRLDGRLRHAGNGEEI